MEKEHLGRTIKRLREAADMTKAELRRATGVPYDTINKLESEKQSSTSPEYLAALAEVLGPEILPEKMKEGFSEPGEGYKQRAARLLETLPPYGAPHSEIKEAPQHENEIKIGTVGRLAQVVATVDRKGIEDLIKKLNKIKDVIDE